MLALQSLSLVDSQTSGQTQKNIGASEGHLAGAQGLGALQSGRDWGTSLHCPFQGSCKPVWSAGVQHDDDRTERGGSDDGTW